MFWRFNYMKAVGKINSNDIKGALELFEKMIDRKPKFYAKVQYAYFLLKDGRYDDARKVFDKYILNDKNKKNENDTVLSKISYAILVWKEGDLDEAIRITREVFQNYKNTVVYINLGFFLIIDGKLDEALEINKKAYDFSPDNPAVIDNLGNNYFLLGMNNEAKKLYEKLFSYEKKPTFAEAYYNYANVLLKENDNEKARACLDQALTMEYSNLGVLTKKDVEEKIKSLS